MKVDDDSFKLADAGIGATVTSNFTRGKFVGLVLQEQDIKHLLIQKLK